MTSNMAAGLFVSGHRLQKCMLAAVLALATPLGMAAETEVTPD